MKRFAAAVAAVLVLAASGAAAAERVAVEPVGALGVVLYGAVGLAARRWAPWADTA